MPFDNKGNFIPAGGWLKTTHQLNEEKMAAGNLKARMPNMSQISPESDPMLQALQKAGGTLAPGIPAIPTPNMSQPYASPTAVVPPSPQSAAQNYANFLSPIGNLNSGMAQALQPAPVSPNVQNYLAQFPPMNGGMSDSLQKSMNTPLPANIFNHPDWAPLPGDQPVNPSNNSKLASPEIGRSPEEALSEAKGTYTYLLKTKSKDDAMAGAMEIYNKLIQPAPNNTMTYPGAPPMPSVQNGAPAAGDMIPYYQPPKSAAQQMSDIINRDPLQGAISSTWGKVTDAVGAVGDFIKGGTTPDIQNKNVAEDFGAAFQRWTNNTEINAGQVANMLNMPNLGQHLIQNGQQRNSHYALDDSHSFKGWQSLLDPHYVASAIGENMPTTVAFMPLGLLGSSLGGAAATGLKFGPFGRIVMQGLGAGALTSPIESAMEAGQTYDQAIREGHTPEEASKMANRDFWGNMALLGITNGVEFANAFLPKGASKFMNKIGADSVVGKIASGVAMEGGEEGAQQWIQNAVQGKPNSLNDPSMQEQMIIGGLMGGGFGTVGALHESRNAIKEVQHQVLDQLSDEDKNDMRGWMQDKIENQGMSEDQALNQAMDMVAQHPDGKAIITDALNHITTSESNKKLATAPTAADLMVAQQQATKAQQTNVGKAQALESYTGLDKEIRRIEDPYGIFQRGTGNENVVYKNGENVNPPAVASDTRLQGPKETFTQGNFVRIPGKSGIFQVAEDRSGNKQKVISSTGETLHIPPQAFRKFESFQVGDRVNVPNRDGVFTIQDMRDGKRIRVVDDQGKGLHFNKNELTPAISGGVAQKAPVQAQLEAPAPVQKAPTAEEPQKAPASVTTAKPKERSSSQVDTQVRGEGGLKAGDRVELDQMRSNGRKSFTIQSVNPDGTYLMHGGGGPGFGDGITMDNIKYDQIHTVLHHAPSLLVGHRITFQNPTDSKKTSEATIEHFHKGSPTVQVTLDRGQGKTMPYGVDVNSIKEIKNRKRLKPEDMKPGMDIIWHRYGVIVGKPNQGVDAHVKFLGLNENGDVKAQFGYKDIRDIGKDAEFYHPSEVAADETKTPVAKVGIEKKSPPPKEADFHSYDDAMQKHLDNSNVEANYGSLKAAVDAFVKEHGAQEAGGFKVGDFVRKPSYTRESTDQKGKNQEIFFDDTYGTVIGFSKNGSGKISAAVAHSYKLKTVPEQKWNRGYLDAEELENMNFIPEKYRNEMSFTDADVHFAIKDISAFRRKEQARWDEIIAEAKSESPVAKVGIKAPVESTGFKMPWEMSKKDFMADTGWVPRHAGHAEQKNAHYMIQPNGKEYPGGWTAHGRTAEKAKAAFHEDKVYFHLRNDVDSVSPEAVATYPDLKLDYENFKAAKSLVHVAGDKLHVNVDGKDDSFDLRDWRGNQNILDGRGFVTSHNLLSDSFKQRKAGRWDLRETMVGAINQVVDDFKAKGTESPVAKVGINDEAQREPDKKPADAPTFKAGQYVNYKGKVYKIHAIHNKGYVTELATLQDPRMNVGAGPIASTNELTIVPNPNETTPINENVTKEQLDQQLKGMRNPAHIQDYKWLNEQKLDDLRLIAKVNGFPHSGIKAKVIDNIIRLSKALGKIDGMDRTELESKKVVELKALLKTIDERTTPDRKDVHINKLVTAKERFQQRGDWQAENWYEEQGFGSKVRPPKDLPHVNVGDRVAHFDPVTKTDLESGEFLGWGADDPSMAKVKWDDGTTDEISGFDIRRRATDEQKAANVVKANEHVQENKFLTDRNRDNWNPTHTYDGHPVETLDLPAIGEMAYRYQEMRKDVASNKWGGMIKKSDAAEMAKLVPIQEEEAAPSNAPQETSKGRVDEITVTHPEGDFTAVRGGYVAAYDPSNKEFVPEKVNSISIAKNEINGKPSDQLYPTTYLMSENEVAGILKWIDEEYINGSRNIHLKTVYMKADHSLMSISYSIDNSSKEGWINVGHDGELSEPSKAINNLVVPDDYIPIWDVGNFAYNWSNGGKQPKENGITNNRFDVMQRLDRGTTIKAPETLRPLPENAADLRPGELKTYTYAMRELMTTFQNRIKGDTLPTTQKELRKLASDVLGRPATEDEWSDALEAAMQEHVAHMSIIENREYEGKKDYALRLAKTQITQGEKLEALMKKAGRSLEKTSRQQYSTPIPLAAIADYALDLKKGDIVKEGSAGTGSLIIGIKDRKYEVKTVELSPRRAAILAAQGIHAENNDTFQTKIESTVTIGNPPFRGENTHKDAKGFTGNPPWIGGWGDLGNRFLAWDLRQLPEGGRLVYVVSPSVIDGAQNAQFRKWLTENHTVRAMVKIQEGGYDSRGTTFGAGLIVVDKGKITDAPASIKGTATSWENLLEMMQPTEGEGIHARVVQPTNTRSSAAGNQPGGQSPDVRNGEQQQRPSNPNSANGGSRSGLDAGGSSAEAGVSNRPGGRGNAVGSNNAGNERTNANDSGQRTSDMVETEQNGVPGKLPSSGAATVGANNEGVSVDNRSESERSAETNIPSFVEYVPRRRFNNTEHRGDVVEPASMNMVEYPEEAITDAQFAPHPSVVNVKGAKYQLSDVQLESVMLAKYNYSKNKRGMLIADDTGLGKTAELLGIAADAWNSGRNKRILFVTKTDQIAQSSFLAENKAFGFNMPMVHVNPETHKNFKDDRRLELERTQELLARMKPDERQKHLDEVKKNPYQPLPVKDGTIVMSYFTFRDAQYAANEWLNGANGDVLVLFDESHVMKNVDGGAQVAEAGANLFNTFKDKAQFIYSSATAAEDIGGLEHLFGLKLWDTATFGQFRTRLQGAVSGSTGSSGKKKNPLARALGGKASAFQREVPLSMMEQIVRELKSDGQYIGRNLSMEGIEMHGLPIGMSAKDKGDWNRAVDFIQRIALKAEEHGNKPTDRGKIMAGVVGYMRRLRSYYVMKGIIPHMQQMQKDGTLERFALTGFFKSGDEGNNAMVATAIKAINDQDKYRDGDGATVYTDIPEAIDDKNSLLSMLRGESAEYGFESPLPDLPSPIKMLYDAFGEGNVAVITGDVTPKERIAMVSDFTSGKKPIIFFTQAGNTGISLHDTIHKQIGFYHVDYPYEAKEAKQSEGRVNRTGQTTKPTYFYPYTDSSVDTKFVGTLLARYEAMGALSRGNTTSIGGESLGDFDFSGPVAETAAERFIPELDPDDRATMFGDWTREAYADGAEFSEHSVWGSNSSNKVKKLLNAMMFLDFDAGNRVFNEFVKMTAQVKSEMEAEGGLSDKFNTYKGTEISSSAGSGGIVIRKIQTKLTDAEKKAMITKVAKAENDLEEAKNATAIAVETAKVNLKEKFDKETAKMQEISDRQKSINELYRTALTDRTLDDKEFARLSDKRNRVLEESNKQFARLQETKNKIASLEKGTKESIQDIPVIRQAYGNVSVAEYRLLNAQAEQEANDLVTLIDGRIATTGLMVPIRTALRKAAKERYKTDDPPSSALKLDIRGFYLDDGRKVVGAVVPLWAEGEVSKALNARLEYAGAAGDMKALMDHIKGGTDVRLENGFELSWRPQLQQMVIKNMTRAHEAIYHQLQDVNKQDFGFLPNSQAFVVRTEEGLRKLIERFPIVDTGAGPKSGGGTHNYSAPLNAPATVLAAPPALQTGLVKRSDIYNFIKKNFKVPIGTGRFRQRALGIYKDFVGEIRSKTYGDFIVLAHELGHRLDDKYKFSGDPAFASELSALAHTLQLPGNMTKEDIRAEGVAEFMRRFLYDPMSAQTDSPLFFSHFENVLQQNKQLASALKLRDMLQTWHSQVAREQIQSVTETGGRKPEKTSFGEKLDDANVMLFDSLGGIDSAVQKLTKGKQLAANKNPYMLAWQARGAAGRIEAFLEYGVVDENGKKIGDSLKEILSKKNVPDLSLFRDYLEALRAKELHEQQRYLTPIEEKNAQMVIDRVHNAPDGQKYQDSADKLYTFQKSVLNELVESGFISEERRNRWDNQHLFYVPFYRVMEESGARTDKGSGGKAGNTYANLNNPVHAMKESGSALNIVDPLESIIKNAYLFISLAQHNNVGSALLDLVGTNEDSAQIAAVVANPIQVTTFTLETIADMLEVAGFDVNDPKVNLKAMASLFTNTFRPDPVKRIVNVWRNGNIIQLQIRDKLLYHSMVSMDPEPLKLWVKLFSIPNKIVKAGITLAPSFMPKNPARGLPTMLMQSDSVTTPLDYAKLPFLLAKNLWGAAFHTDDYWKWVSTGGGQSTLNGIQKDYLQGSSDKILRRDFMDTVKRNKLILPAVLKALRHVSELGDAPFRMTEHQMAMEKTGDPTLAAVRSRDVDMDFNRFGSQTQTINEMNLFFNIAMQGPNRVYRTFKAHPIRSMMRGSLFLTLPAMLLMMLNYDDPDYWDLPQWERDLYFIIPTGAAGPLKFVKIPIPFEWGLIFKVIPERIAAYTHGDKDLSKQFSSLGKTLAATLIPSIIPSVIEPFVEWVTNKNMFTGNPVVPDRMKNDPLNKQTLPYTTETAKIIGKLTHASPIKVDNAVKGYLGTLGQWGMGMIDWTMAETGITHAAPKPTGEGLLGDRGAFARAFTTSPTEKSSQNMDDFYIKLQSLEQLHTANPQMKGHPSLELVKFRKVSADLTAIRAMRDILYTSTKLDPEQKRTMVSDLNSGMTDLARQTMGGKPDDSKNMNKMRVNASNFIKQQNKPYAIKFVESLAKSLSKSQQK